MEARLPSYVAGAVGGEWCGKPATSPVRRVCIDSRAAGPGDLFFALPGPKHDGHDFLREVDARGVAAMVAERSRLKGPFPECPVILVDDTRAALGRLGARYRRDFSPDMIAVGGSNGKTTTKELLAAVLRQDRPVLASEASFNNEIGVPLTLLGLEPSHRAAVLEAGTNHPGELAPLLRMIVPRYGVLTSIGREHLEFFGDLEGVAREEGAMADAIPKDGCLFVNGDSPWSDAIAQRCHGRVIRVGLEAGNDWTARDVRVEDTGVAFRAEGPRADLAGEYRVQLLGRHQAGNALLALAVAGELGLGREAIRRGLAACAPAKMRLQLRDCGGVRVLDDAYNANADSVLAALQTLSHLPCAGRRVAVLGEMAELGAASGEAHAEAGRRAAEFHIDKFFAVGPAMAAAAGSARRGGLHATEEIAGVEEAAAAVRAFARPGDLVLVKASRSARLERVTEALCGAPAGKGRS